MSRHHQEDSKVDAFAERFLDAIPLPIDVVDEDSNIVYMNRKLEGMVGKEALGKKCYLVFKDNREQCADCPRTKSAGVGEVGAIEIEGALGGRALRITHSAIDLGGRRVILETLEDITEHRQDSELVSALSNSQTVGIYIVQNGRFQFVNLQFQKQSGYSEDELLGTDPLRLVVPEDRSLVRMNAIKMLKGERRTPYEFRIVNKAGEIRWTMETVASIRYGGGLATLGNFMDITERKQAEEKLKEAHDTLELRVEERTAELARSNAELQQFAYVASHDLQEPLRVIASYVRLLEQRYKGRLAAEADEFIAYAVDGATRMQDLINDLLAYSRVGTTTKPFEYIDCSATLNRALVNLRLAINTGGAVVTQDPLPAVRADASQLAQLFQNLIGNAIKFHGEEPPRVHVSAERKGNEWVFAVSDNGIGIAPQFLERIFVIFQRLHGRSKYPGTGIGLAICRKIVERHGGRIWAESEPGKGSTFYFVLPIEEPATQRQSSRQT